jgi:hypothetical protein
LVSTAVVVSAQKQALNGNSRQVNLPAKFTTRKTRVFRSLLLGYFHGEIFFVSSIFSVANLFVPELSLTRRCSI